MLKNFQFRRLTSVMGGGKADKQHLPQDSRSRSKSAPKADVAPNKPNSTSASCLPKPAEAQAEKQRVWREARDPKTGRTYYYDVETRETQWSKPEELMSPTERADMERRETEKRAFFEEMEANMKRRFAEGLTSVDMGAPSAKTNGIGWRPPRPSSGSFSGEPGRMVRTLSTMDDSFLQLAQSTSVRHSLSPTSRRDSNADHAMPRIPEQMRSAGTLPVAHSAGALPVAAKSSSRPHRAPSDLEASARLPGKSSRNSTGTLFLDATLQSPNKDATIRCVCHVVRAHIAASQAQPWRADNGYFAVFHDPDAEPVPPSARRLVSFYRDVFSRGQMELECIVTSLIYVERLLKAARGKFRLKPSNWRPVLLSCMIMASKVCDDLSMWNADFSHICRAFDLARINALEAALLQAYGYNATVAASEYAKYYFHLRSMAARLGLGTNDRDQPPSPLDVRAARALAARSRRLQSAQDLARQEMQPDSDAEPIFDAGAPHEIANMRAQSIGVESQVEDAIKRNQKPKAPPAILEQIVDMAPSLSAS